MIGPPACGKGTQAKYLADNLSEDVTHISTGDLIRRRLKDFSGDYIDDSTIEKLLSEEIQETQSNLYILDGVPRTIGQINMIENLFDLKKVIYFSDMRRETIEERINNRGRNEDPYKRLLDYIEKSAPVPEYFSIMRDNIFYKVNGEKTVEELNKEIFNLFI